MNGKYKSKETTIEISGRPDEYIITEEGHEPVNVGFYLNRDNITGRLSCSENKKWDGSFRWIDKDTFETTPTTTMIIQRFERIK